MLRLILIVSSIFLSSASWASEICDNLLKEDFRESTNISLAYNNSGLVLKKNQPIIDKKRYGSYAFNTPLLKGDRIVEIDNIKVPQDDKEAYLYLSNILETKPMRDLTIKVKNNNKRQKIVKLIRQPYLGHPEVEANILLNNIQLTQQSSKTSLDLDLNLSWVNEDLIDNIFRITGVEKRKIKEKNLSKIYCVYTKKNELENILQKIWYPNFEIDERGSLFERQKFKKLIITNQDKKYNFILEQNILIKINNNSDYRDFPFDSTTTTASFLFHNTDMSIFPFYNKKLTKNNGNDYLYEWELYDHDISIKTKIKNQGVQQKIIYFLELKRKSFHYTFKIILPVIFLVLLSLSVFFIRPEELESRLAVSVGSLLTLVAYNFVFADDVPKLNFVSILDAGILLSYFFAALSTFLTIRRYNVYMKSNKKEPFLPIDEKLKIIIPSAYFFSWLMLWIAISNNWWSQSYV